MSAACGGNGRSTSEVITVTGVSPAGQYVEHSQIVSALIIQAEQPIFTVLILQYYRF